MKKIKFAALSSVVLTTTLLFGCFGEGDVPKEKETNHDYSDSTAISQKEKSKLDALIVELEEKAYEDIRASDYTIEHILLKDLDKSYYYGGILNMEYDTIFQQQLKYFEVHREYMIYLERNGATKSELIYNNRKFHSYLATLEGRHIEGLKHVKRALEKTFYRYNVLELEAILNNESVEKFIKEERKLEDKRGMWDWFRKEENANFKGDILYFTNVKFDLLEPSDKDVVTEYNKLLKDYAAYSKDDFTGKKQADVVKYVKGLIKKVENSRLNEDSEWIKLMVTNYLNAEIKRAELVFTNDSVDLANDDFFIDISRQEQLVSISSFEHELGLQDEKRKQAKEDANKSKDKEKE